MRINQLRQLSPLNNLKTFNPSHTHSARVCVCVCNWGASEKEKGQRTPSGLRAGLDFCWAEKQWEVKSVNCRGGTAHRKREEHLNQGLWTVKTNVTRRTIMFRIETNPHDSILIQNERTGEKVELIGLILYSTRTHPTYFLKYKNNWCVKMCKNKSECGMKQ